MQKVTKKIKAVEPTIAIGVKILAWPWAAALARNPELHHFSRLKQWLASSPRRKPTTLFGFEMGAEIFHSLDLFFGYFLLHQGKRKYPPVGRPILS